MTRAVTSCSVATRGPKGDLAVREALAVLSSDERIAFSLRHLEELELTEVASACGVSLSTVKRRLKRAEERFDALALRDPRLAGWRRVEEP